MKKQIFMAVACMAAIAITGPLTAQTSPAAIAATKTSSNNEKITDAGACVVKITSSATGCDIVVDHSIVSPRDHASGQASGKRMHKPYCYAVSMADNSVVEVTAPKQLPLPQTMACILYRQIARMENMT